jgi:hypothetical protein
VPISLTLPDDCEFVLPFSGFSGGASILLSLPEDCEFALSFSGFSGAEALLSPSAFPSGLLISASSPMSAVMVFPFTAVTLATIVVLLYDAFSALIELEADEESFEVFAPHPLIMLPTMASKHNTVKILFLMFFMLVSSFHDFSHVMMIPVLCGKNMAAWLKWDDFLLFKFY